MLHDWLRVVRLSIGLHFIDIVINYYIFPYQILVINDPFHGMRVIINIAKLDITKAIKYFCGRHDVISIFILQSLPGFFVNQVCFHNAPVKAFNRDGIADIPGTIFYTQPGRIAFGIHGHCISRNLDGVVDDCPKFQRFSVCFFIDREGAFIQDHVSVRVTNLLFDRVGSIRHCPKGIIQALQVPKPGTAPGFLTVGILTMLHIAGFRAEISI